MCKKFVNWFIIFGLSFLVSNIFGWTEQGKAFLYIHLGVFVVILLGTALFLAIGGMATRDTEANEMSFILISVTARILAITLFATWGATKLFGVNFYVAYQIMTFGQCLCTNHEKEDD